MVDQHNLPIYEFQDVTQELRDMLGDDPMKDFEIRALLTIAEGSEEDSNRMLALLRHRNRSGICVIECDERKFPHRPA